MVADRYRMDVPAASSEPAAMETIPEDGQLTVLLVDDVPCMKFAWGYPPHYPDRAKIYIPARKPQATVLRLSETTDAAAAQSPTEFQTQPFSTAEQPFLLRYTAAIKAIQLHLPRLLHALPWSHPYFQQPLQRTEWILAVPALPEQLLQHFQQAQCAMEKTPRLKERTRSGEWVHVEETLLEAAKEIPLQGLSSRLEATPELTVESALVLRTEFAASGLDMRWYQEE